MSGSAVHSNVQKGAPYSDSEDPRYHKLMDRLKTTTSEKLLSLFYQIEGEGIPFRIKVQNKVVLEERQL